MRMWWKTFVNALLKVGYRSLGGKWKRKGRREIQSWEGGQENVDH